MSRILFARTLLPSATDPVIDLVPEAFDGHLTIPKVRSIPKPDAELFQFGDRSVYRSLSRAAVMLSACCEGIERHLQSYRAADPFCVGIYTACDWGTISYENVGKIAGASPQDFAAGYKRTIHPKQPLKHSSAIVAAHLGIFLGVMGPINCYTHSEDACYNAVEQAELDLETGVIRAAVVCAATSADDPLLCVRSRQKLDEATIFSEGAAVILLAAARAPLKWDAMNTKSAIVNFGIATPLIQFVNQMDQNG